MLKASFTSGGLVGSRLDDGIHARECNPPLTAVNLHLDDVAQLGVELLFEHIAGRTERKSVAGPLATLVFARVVGGWQRLTVE